MELYDQYWDKIYHIVRRRTGYPEFAQDIAQDVFILVWDKRQDFKDVQCFNALPRYHGQEPGPAVY